MGFFDNYGVGANLAAENFAKIWELNQRRKLEQQRLDQNKILVEATAEERRSNALIKAAEQMDRIRKQQLAEQQMQGFNNAMMGAVKPPQMVSPAQAANIPIGMLGGAPIPNMPGDTRGYEMQSQREIPGGMDINQALTATIPFLDQETQPKWNALKHLQSLPVEEQKAALAAMVANSQVLRNNAQAQKALQPDDPNWELKTEERYDEKTGLTFERSFTYNKKTREKSDYSDWVPKKKDKEPIKVTTNVENKIGASSMEKLGEEMSKDLVVQRKDAQGAVTGLNTVYEGKKLLDAGMITGTGAKFLTGFGSLLSSRLGFKQFKDPVANTQAYVANMGRATAQIIKQFGAGTGLSDADREYADNIAGGNIELTEESIRRILDMSETAFAYVVDRFNKDAEKAMGKPGADQLPYDLRLEKPKPYKQPKKPLSAY